MITFKESLNSELPYHVTIWKEKTALFHIDRTWNVIFNRVLWKDKWTLGISFDHTFHGSSATGGNDVSKAMAVYATIGNVLAKYIDEFPVDEISFSAVDFKMDPVYKRLANKIASRIGRTAYMQDGQFWIK